MLAAPDTGLQQTRHNVQVYGRKTDEDEEKPAAAAAGENGNGVPAKVSLSHSCASNPACSCTAHVMHPESMLESACSNWAGVDLTRMLRLTFTSNSAGSTRGGR